MKKIIKQIFILASLVAVFASCKKDEKRVQFEGGTDPVLTASVTNNEVIPLAFVNADNEAIKFSWTNPDYQFTTGLSSQDVNYTIEIDKAGEDFSSDVKKTISIANDLSTTLTQAVLDDILLNQLSLPKDVQNSIEVRVKANLLSGAGIVYSNSYTFLVTPYAIPPKVTPPGTPPLYADGRLFLVGSATPGGWNNPVPEPAQEFTQVAGSEGTKYEIIVPISGGGSYLFLPVNGSWNAKFGYTGANNTNNPDGDDFKPGGGDMLAPAGSGNYKIEVDFQRGKFTVTHQ
jgi:hypothetical protein